MRLLAVALVAAITLAGCSGSTEETSSSTSDTSSSAPSSTSSPTTTDTTSTTTSSTTTSRPPPPEGNHAPVAVLRPEPRVGVAPANITFRLDVQDADGANDTHSWRLTFGDGTPLASGTELPFTVVHNYADIGNYTAVLLVSDMYGVEDTVEELVVINPVYFPPILFEGVADLPCSSCTPSADVGEIACVGYRTEFPELDCDWTEIPANATLQPFVATSVATAAEVGSDIGLIFTTNCVFDTTVVAAYDANGADEAETGDVPAGAGCLIVYENNNTGIAFTVRIG